jgi:hypothetical protein
MTKHTYFHDHHGQGWPPLDWLEPYFLTAAGRREAFGKQESWGLKRYGVDGTEHMQRYKGRIDIDLTIQGDPDHGILLFHDKSGGGRSDGWYSKGDQTKMNRWVETIQGDQLPVGLFISFETAWKAVKEFVERDGALPQSIEWIADRDLPANAFMPP